MSIDQSSHERKKQLAASHVSSEVVSRVHRHVDEYSSVMRNLSPTTSPFSSFSPKPIRTRFATQDSQENILLLLRKHPVTQLPWIAIATIGALIPAFVDPGQLLSFLPSAYQLAATITWYTAILFFILESFLSWYYNVYIITDERVVDIDFYSLIYRNISSAKLDRIEDVTAKTRGALQTVVNYGTVYIQTAGTREQFEFEDVPKPNTIVQFLNELLQEEELEQLEGRVA
jgi:hypothetical protein